MARLLFIGGTKRGYLALEALIENGAELVGVICLKQHAHEKEIYDSKLEEISIKNQIPFFQTASMKERDYAALIQKELRPAVAFLVGCRVLLPKEVIDAPTMGSFAVHDSLLPEYRGFAPLNWALINGEKQTGVTLFKVTEAMDAGGILSQETIPILETDNANTLYEKVCASTNALVVNAEKLLRTGVLPALRPQDEAAATYTCSRNPGDGWIDWSRPSGEIHNLVRALIPPYPGATTYYKGKRLILVETSLPPLTERYVGKIPGRVIQVAREEGYVDVLTSDGKIRIHRVALADGTEFKASQIITSVRESLGLGPLELLAKIEELELKKGL